MVSHAVVALKVCIAVIHQYSLEAVMVCHPVVALKVCMGVVHQYSP